ncbi:hypothetical protein E2562_036865 [Oryza meyeriana var. granulata]|uniref:Uncharacterized protein n=1 Tax=Oryza meyeriana var. granulata TaxID=110450 RepID=A0A6G1CZ11_9ORYZ|nr:hypothetical protein E2562_036865 [Oryza meyeriana var. granulata]
MEEDKQLHQQQEEAIEAKAASVRVLSSSEAVDRLHKSVLSSEAVDVRRVVGGETGRRHPARQPLAAPQAAAEDGQGGRAAADGGGAQLPPVPILNDVTGILKPFTSRTDSSSSID